MVNNLLKLLIIFALYSFCNVADAKTCYLASDFGLGGTTIINSNPDDDENLSKKKLTNPLNPNQSVNTALIQYYPQTHQIAPWVYTHLITTGIAVNTDGTNSQYTILKGYVNGEWYPWLKGYPTTTPCVLEPCSQNVPKDEVCLSGGEIVTIDSSASSPNNYPCVLNSGLGLYGLIAVENNGQYLDPNELDNALTLPSAYFRTFNAKATTQDNEGHQIFEIDHTQLCALDPLGNTNCKIDKTAQGINYVIKGKLYFKILDTYYVDNAGQYTVTVTSGVYSDSKGFIQSTVSIFQNAMKKITKHMYIAITQDLQFVNITRALLVLYIAITGFAFLTGIMKIEQKELVIRLIKVGLIATVISPMSWNFFNEYLFTLFQSAMDSFSKMIINATLYYNDNPNQPKFLMPANGSPLAVFDNFLNLMISKQVNYKILSMLFFEWQLYFIPAIYICWIMIMMGIFRSVFLYVLAIFQLSLLIVSGPIFIIMMLFQITKSLFDGWIQIMINNVALMLLVISTLALMMGIILNQLENLLYYQICWEVVWSPSIIGITLFDLYFWYPTYASQVSAALTLGHFFALLMVSLVFTGFLEQIPQIADSLVASQRPTSAASAQSAMSALQGSFMGSALNTIKGLNPVGMAMHKLEGVPLVGQAAKMTRGVITDPHKTTKIVNRIYKSTDKGPVTNFLPTEGVNSRFREGFNKVTQKNDEEQ